MSKIASSPCHLYEAWERLCDALEERMTAFGAVGLARIPRQLPPPVKYDFSTDEMRLLITIMVNNSFNPLFLGKWATFGSPEMSMHSIDSPDGKFYKDFDIDPYPFLRRAPPDLPSFRHTVSQFINSAAWILTKVVRFPAPWKRSRNGFFLDADLRAETFSPAQSASGKYSQGNVSLKGYYDGEERRINASPLFPAYRDHWGRSDAKNLRWVYKGAGGAATGTDPVPSPILRGKCPVKTTGDHISFSRGTSADPEQKPLYFGEQLFEMDFDTGEADRTYDLSGAQNYINTVWNGNFDIDNEGSRTVRLEPGSFSVMLTGENFPVYDFKYR